MEVNQFFVDKVMSNSSQDAYLVTPEDAATYQLAVVPSIQEIVLSKCNLASAQELDMHHRLIRTAATPAELYLKRQLEDKIVEGSICEGKEQRTLQRAALVRELRTRDAAPPAGPSR